MELNDNQYTLLGIIIGGIGLKVIDYFAQRRKDKAIEHKAQEDAVVEMARHLEERDAAAKAEMRADLKELRDRQDAIIAELDEWKEKYWKKAQELNDAQRENARLLIELVKAGQNAQSNE
jgi:hypothetical protein